MASFLLCKMCHHVKHIGLAGILANQGKLDFNAVVSHYCKVNGCNTKDFQQHQKDAFTVWRQRSSHSWKQDFGEYGKYLIKVRAKAFVAYAYGG